MTDANTDSQAYRGYTESRILSAHPVEIVHLLYRVAIDNLQIAVACLKTSDIPGRSRAVTKAQEAVQELMVALDRAASPSISRNLAELYDYVLRQIIEGHTRRSEKAFEDALRVLKILSEGWSGVKANVMGGADAESSSVPEEQTEAEPRKEVSRLYAEPAQDPETARDWSC
jgi:flagellar secretion chaperone FliS